MKKSLIAFQCICIFFLLAGRGGVALEKRTLRIISLAPAVTEILFSLRVGDAVVGVTTFCDYPPEALMIEKVGTFSQPNIEKIISLKPDIIFATGLEQASVVRELRQLKLKVFVSDPATINELFVSIEKIALLIDREKEGKRLIAAMKTKIERISYLTKDIPTEKRPKVFIEVWDDPLITVGSNSFVDELVTLSGGINITQDILRAYSYVSPESIIQRDPDCIILGHRSGQDAASIVKSRLGWEKVKAVENNCIYNDISPDIIFRPGPRLVDALEQIHKKLYSNEE